MKDLILDEMIRMARSRARLMEYCCWCVYWECPTHALEQIQIVRWDGPNRFYEKIQPRDA